ncbi:NUDIX domain-containing protein [Aerococcaceae bacterium DSM 111020]|nr:NUDIX domain-containing protein [Aerococcaceae bacterium DSM 111020]
MKHEKSCGAVVYYINTLQKPEYLLIQHQNGGHWSFPKGHVEKDETEIETAMREIYEETSLDVSIDERFREVTTYSPGAGIIKDVIYFIAEAKNQKARRQEIEVIETQWLSFEKALDKLNYESDKKILTAAHQFLNHY